ncbi:hypothetical protein ACQKNC_02235, partial [Lysinibacillus sp. NPDC094177]|uniref:hypothetical protein n=1 Tax=Lysinibacillus sp. NPDC094177 TaxID=3390580 RepID=UPI003CFDB0FD
AQRQQQHKRRKWIEVCTPKSETFETYITLIYSAITNISLIILFFKFFYNIKGIYIIPLDT